MKPVLIPCTLLAASLLTGCDQPLSIRTGSGIRLALSASMAGDGANDAYAKVDEVHIVLSTSGGGVAADERLPFRPAGNAPVPVEIVIESEFADQSLSIKIDLLSSGAPIFDGTGQVTPTIGEPASANIFLNPVVDDVDAPDAVGPITAIGASLQLEASPVFATGDIVPNFAVEWTALDPTIVSVSRTGLATANAEGVGRVQASSGAASAVVRVTVQAQVVRVQVSPPVAEVNVNSTVSFTAVPFDANNNALAGRTAQWESSDPSILQVISPGIALGVQPGEAEMVATIDGVEGFSTVTVNELVPTAPGNFVAAADYTTVFLTWVDQADNETRYEVVRVGPGFPPEGDVILLPPNSMGYTDATGTEDAQFEYTVRACNDSGCAASDVAIVATVPRTPSEGRISGNVIAWTDTNEYEDYFAVEGYSDAGWDGPFETPGTEPCPVDSGVEEKPPCFDFGPTPPFYYGFHVAACNDAGCSDFLVFGDIAPEESEVWTRTATARPGTAEARRR